jgi:tRNA-dihydrouridine synthase
MQPAPQIYLAPFQGITGFVFREVYTKHFPGIDKLFTPFFTNIFKSKSLERKGKELSKTGYNGEPVVPQILSKDAAEITRFGNFCHERGFKEINWNLGCPFPRVANKKRGSGMLPHPDLVKSILDEVSRQLPLKLSVKCRLGYHGHDEIFKLLPVFETNEISELIVHARLGTQMYKGNVDLDTFETVASSTRLPLVYNGDVLSIEGFNSLKGRFSGIGRWMIGRGLLADPFLPGDIKQGIISPEQGRPQKVKRFVDDLYYTYRKHNHDSLHTINIMKELWGYLSYSFEDQVRVFSLVKKTKSFNEYEDAVNRIFLTFTWLGTHGKYFGWDLD